MKEKRNKNGTESWQTVNKYILVKTVYYILKDQFLQKH